MNTGCCCTICLELLLDDLQATQCGHVFHRLCIYRWFDQKSSCPNCKSPIDVLKLSQLYYNPLNLINELFKDPSCLSSVAPNLLLQFAQNVNNNNNNNNNDDNENENENEKLPITNTELTSLRIRNIAYEQQMKENERKLLEMEEKYNKCNEEKKGLSTKINNYLRVAQTNENRYFDAEDECKRLNRELYKKNKECIELQDKFVTMRQRQVMYEHISSMLEQMNDDEKKIEDEIINDNNKDINEKLNHFLEIYRWIKKRK